MQLTVKIEEYQDQEAWLNSQFRNQQQEEIRLIRHVRDLEERLQSEDGLQLVNSAQRNS